MGSVQLLYDSCEEFIRKPTLRIKGKYCSSFPHETLLAKTVTRSWNTPLAPEILKDASPNYLVYSSASLYYHSNGTKVDLRTSPL